MKCPACFYPLPEHPEFGVCHGSCPPVTQTWGADQARGYPVSTPTIFQLEGELTPCPTCSGPALEACGYCAYAIPTACRTTEGTPCPGTYLTFAGARATGKSLTIATMVQQFRLLATRFWRHPVTPIGTTANRFDNGYLYPLYHARQVMTPTPELAAGDAVSREPLVFSFRAPGPDGELQNRVLAIRDVAGEDLEALGARNATSFEFFARADAVIALLDPLKVPQIQHYLGGLIPPPDRLGGDGLAVLDQTLRAIHSGLRHPRHPGGAPALGIALSKFDVLQQLSNVEAPTWPDVMGRPGSPMQRDPSLAAADYDVADADLLHHEIYGLLQLLRVETVLGMAASSGLNFRYFATSALGASPSATTLHASGIVPFRVLDPLKWAMQGQVQAS